MQGMYSASKGFQVMEENRRIPVKIAHCDEIDIIRCPRSPGQKAV
jgi:hypothetical protein